MVCKEADAERRRKARPNHREEGCQQYITSPKDDIA